MKYFEVNIGETGFLFSNDVTERSINIIAFHSGGYALRSSVKQMWNCYNL